MELLQMKILAQLVHISAQIESVRAIFFGAMRELIDPKMAFTEYQLYWEFYLESLEETLSKLQLSSHVAQQIRDLLNQEIDYALKKRQNPYFDRPDLKNPFQDD